MVWKCDKCGKEFGGKSEADKHEKICKLSPILKVFDLPEKIEKKLSTFLHDDENILYQFKGAFGTHQRWTDANTHSSAGLTNTSGAGGQWGSPWLILTNQRLIIIGKGVFTFDVREIPYEHIKSLDYEQGFLQDRLMVHAHSSTEAIQFLSGDRKVTSGIPKIVNELMKKHKFSEEIKNEEYRSSADEIEKLYSLMKRGIISKVEFEKKKKDLL
jgi:hypothetical protein